MDGPWRENRVSRHDRMGYSVANPSNEELLLWPSKKPARRPSQGEDGDDQRELRPGGGGARCGVFAAVPLAVKTYEMDVLKPADVGKSVSARMNTHVYDFSEGAELGRELLGGKGAGLAQMTAIGIPVPAGFTVTTAACIAYMQERPASAGRARGGDRDAHEGARGGRPASASATRRIRCSSRSARAQRSRCQG